MYVQIHRAFCCSSFGWSWKGQSFVCVVGCLRFILHGFSWLAGCPWAWWWHAWHGWCRGWYPQTIPWGMLRQPPGALAVLRIGTAFPVLLWLQSPWLTSRMEVFWWEIPWTFGSVGFPLKPSFKDDTSSEAPAVLPFCHCDNPWLVLPSSPRSRFCHPVWIFEPLLPSKVW